MMTHSTSSVASHGESIVCRAPPPSIVPNHFRSRSPTRHLPRSSPRRALSENGRDVVVPGQSAGPARIRTRGMKQPQTGTNGVKTLAKRLFWGFLGVSPQVASGVHG